MLLQAVGAARALDGRRGEGHRVLQPHRGLHQQQGARGQLARGRAPLVRHEGEQQGTHGQIQSFRKWAIVDAMDFKGGWWGWADRGLPPSVHPTSICLWDKASLFIFSLLIPDYSAAPSSRTFQMRSL